MPTRENVTITECQSWNRMWTFVDGNGHFHKVRQYSLVIDDKGERLLLATRLPFDFAQFTDLMNTPVNLVVEGHRIRYIYKVDS